MLKQCEKCGVFFGADDASQVMCESCQVSKVNSRIKSGSVEELKYQEAKEIVRENPDISPEKLIKEMNEIGFKLTLREIMDYVKQGRMTLKGATDGVFCEECGKKILSGRLCPTCTKKLEEKITGSVKDEDTNYEMTNDKNSKKSHNNRMYSRNKR